MVPIVKPCQYKAGKLAKERIPYFRFYPSDFMRGVRGMTAQEIGLYTMLLCRIYEESGPIENHTLRLATYCGMRLATFEKTLDKIVQLGKIVSQNGVLSNPRAEAEISNRANDLEIAIRAGKASAEKRQQNQRQDATPVQRSFNHTDTDTDTLKREGKPSLALIAPETIKPDMFNEFWERYPRKKSKDDARKAYDKAMKVVDHDGLMFALSERLPGIMAKEPQFQAYPATWLNKGMWKDDIEPNCPPHGPSGTRPSGSGISMASGFAAVAARHVAKPG